MDTKVCSKCERKLPIRAFNKAIGYKNGLHCWCRLCVRRYNANRMKACTEQSTQTMDWVKMRNGILPGILGLQDGAFFELLDCLETVLSVNGGMGIEKA